MSDYKFTPPMKIDVIPPRKNEKIEGEKLLGWTTYTVLGAPVYLTVEDVKNDVRVTMRPLRSGMELIVPTLFGYARATVNGSGIMAESEKALYPLKYCEERECWICDSCIMKSALTAIAKMELK